MKKGLFFSLIAMFGLGFALFGQEEKVSLRFDARADFNYVTNDNNASGFNGKNLNLMLDGQINSKLEYHLRQRLNRAIGGEEGLLNATDWAYLKYHINDNFSIAAGKQVVAIGTFEYDYAPIDCYFLSDFCNNIPCYELGVTFGYTDNSGNHSLQFQVTNSPFVTGTWDNMYAYNLMWSGNMDWFKTLYSINMVEYRKGEFINYIALGNQFTFDNLVLELDYVNRYHANQDGFFDDFSLIGNLKYGISDKWNVFVKGGYDQNNAQPAYTPAPLRWDVCVVPGTEYAFYGAGFEFFPLKERKDVRLHGYFYSSNNEPTQVFFNAGLTWRINAFSR